ncbi:transcription factor p65-like isoform X2 [Anticarsia gemmatalis]|uniref:transcription factor p65-like isoform X2 n=1 Tax=Anticarsia gemmatalis TaxID=129554 RepID=UPI003F774F08
MSLVLIKQELDFFDFENAVPTDDGQNGEPLNISDVFEAITLADPTFGAMAQHPGVPYVRIIEQPASKALRFRYECEGRSAGSIPGVSSTSENKTYPTIKIYGYTGQVVIVVSCVTKEEPHRPHPHNLVGRERCNQGVCTIPTRITEESNEYQFKNLGIQCVKRRDIAEALRMRQGLRVDPFRTGFSHMEHPQSIDLNAVRLCFQVFLPDANGRCRRPLTPVVSDIIFDKKAMSDLHIMRASHCSGTARGGTQVILLCEKVTREDTVVVFFLEENNTVVWEETANLILVHKQVAIAFETPPFKDPHTSDHVTVRFQLKRVTDNARSNSLPFEYIPDYQDMRYKRKKVANILQSYESERNLYQPEQKIKSEPKDKTPPYLPQYGEQWGMDNLQAGVVAYADMWGAPGYSAHPAHPAHPTHGPAQPVSPPMMPQNLQVLTSNVGPISPGMQVLSPHGQAMSPHGQAMSPHGQVMSPHAQVMSPHAQVMSPHGQVMSPHSQVMSPHGQAMSPHGQAMNANLQVMSPQHMGRISPNMQHPQQNMGHISPNLVQQVQQPTYTQMQQSLMETDTHSSQSLSHLLRDGGEGIVLNSGDLSGLSSLLGDEPICQ